MGLLEGKYWKVSWANDKGMILFDNVDKAISQFRYESVFEDDAKITTISKEEYEKEIERIRNK